RYTKEKLPIIVLSSVGEHLMMDEQGLYNAYLTKPVKQARLMDTIIQVLGISPAERAKSRMASGNTETRAAKSRIKVLVAQDNPLSKAVTERTLQLLGHQYELVESSKEILEKSRRDQYDLILIDTDAQAMDGVETTKQLMRMVSREHAPVIIGLSDDATSAKSTLISAGMDDVVSKPMHPEVLQAKIHEYLEV
ncbi:MAG: response regulator, partial [Flavobacteriales bacterium]